MLDLKMLSDMPVGTIFASGEAVDAPGGINMTNSNKMLRWVAIRGHGPEDWAIYCHWDHNDVGWIKRHGDKVHSESHIRKLVPCDNTAFAHYRQ